VPILVPDNALLCAAYFLTVAATALFIAAAATREWRMYHGSVIDDTTAPATLELTFGLRDARFQFCETNITSPEFDSRAWYCSRESVLFGACGSQNGWCRIAPDTSLALSILVAAAGCSLGAVLLAAMSRLAHLIGTAAAAALGVAGTMLADAGFADFVGSDVVHLLLTAPTTTSDRGTSYTLAVAAIVSLGFGWFFGAGGWFQERRAAAKRVAVTRHRNAAQTRHTTVAVPA
jgi:hypothetical protein